MEIRTVVLRGDFYSAVHSLATGLTLKTFVGPNHEVEAKKFAEEYDAKYSEA